MASRTTKWVIGGILAVVVIVGLWVVAIAAVIGSGGASSRGEWLEETIEDAGGEKVAMVSVFGEIFGDPDGVARGATDENIVSQLDQASKDPKVTAIVVDLDTPGGAVVASDTIYRKVLEIRDEGKPVVALMRDVAASGGYYIAAGANHIVANPATLTGSIGVIMFLPNLTGSAEKLGIEPVIIKSGPFKDIASPFKDMSQQEREILEKIIDEAFDQFVSAIVEGREMEDTEVRRLADGRIYTGRQALENGLIDSLGDRAFAFDKAKELAESPDASLVRYVRTVGLAESLLGFSAPDPAEELREAIGFPRPGLHYLWLSP